MLLFVVSIISIIVCHYSIKVSRYNIKSEKLPSEFDEFRIIHLSDLHSRIFDKENSKLVSMIKKETPNIITMTGDMINGRYSDILGLEKLIKDINENISCSIYYIMGNREFRLNKENYDKLKDMLRNNNVKILENNKDKISIGNKNICIYGLNYYNRNEKEYYYNILSYATGDKKEVINDVSTVIEKLEFSKYNILLTHDPKEFEKYSKYGFDLILAGHIHGGVIRIPLLGGLLYPEVRLFPEYDGGIFKNNKSIMCVSKGLGYGTIPFRLFNKPEVVSIKLNKV